MNKLEEARKNAFFVSLSGTQLFLEALKKKNRLQIKSKYPTINTIECELEKGERCFRYSTDPLLSLGPPVKFQHKSYGFQDPFELVNEDRRVIAYKGAGLIRIDIGGGFTSNGEIWELRSSDFRKKAFHRAIIPINGFGKKPLDFIYSLPFKTDRTFRGAGFIKFDVHGYSLGIFDYKVAGSESLIVECYRLISRVHFENVLSSVLYCFGLISGNLIRDEVYLLQYSNKNFHEVEGFEYRRLEESINGLPSINPRLFKEATKTKGMGPYLSKVIFQNMVAAAAKDLRLLRAIKIITESAQYPLEIRASTYSVALETLKNIILEQYEQKINPFRSKKYAKQVITKLKEEVSEIDDSHFNNKNSVMKRIEQLNQVGNKEGFFLCFQMLGIPLSPDDKRCIEKRNDFLHGRIPYDHESDADYELQHIVYKLHLLSASLILKFCGFQGYVLNNLKLVDLLHFKKYLKEDLFRKI